MDFIEAVKKSNLEITRLLSKPTDNLFEYAKKDLTKLGAGGDRSLVVDLKAEEIFVNNLLGFGKIISEESGHIGEGDLEIILDPIDGSSNIVSKFPYYGSSVTLTKNSKPLISVITNLANGEYFVKTNSQFYKANLHTDLKIDVVAEKNIEPQIVGVVEKSYDSKELIPKLFDLKMKYRSPGATALSLAYAHSLSFFIFAGKQRIFDIIGGLHMCQDLNVYSSETLLVVSKDKTIFSRILKLIME